MTKIIIATTEGPSELQRIIEEDADIRSVICLQGTTQELPISNDYHAFVKRPTGVIEKTFGHGAFRVDVSKGISDGESWQLALFLAHAHHAEAIQAEGLIWATGEVDHDLNVKPVLHIKEKLQLSKNVVEEALQDGQKVTLFFAQENYAEGCAVCKALGLDEVEIKSVQSVSDLTTLFAQGTSSTPVTRKQILPALVHQKNKMRWIAAIIVIAALIGSGLYYSKARERADQLITNWQAGELYLVETELARSCFTCSFAHDIVEKHLQAHAVGEDDIMLQVRELGPTKGKSCFTPDRQLLNTIPLTKRLQTVFERKSLCQLDYVVINASDRSLWVKFDVEGSKKSNAFVELKPHEETVLSQPGGFLAAKEQSRSWQLTVAPYRVSSEGHSLTAKWGVKLWEGIHSLTMKVGKRRFQ